MAIYERFFIAWNKSFRQIELESNNVILIDIISNGYAVDNSLSDVQLIYSLL
ncbi:hypothetical protein Gotur_007464, partial [Gossypium turneri]